MSVMAGYGAQPRNIFMYDSESKEWIKTADSLQNYQYQFTTDDIDNGGLNELITWGRAPDNNHARTGFELIPLSEILYCRADGKYTIIQTTDNGEVLSSTNLGAIESDLATDEFVRLGRSIIVNKNYIRKVDRKKGRAYFRTAEGMRELELTPKQVKTLTSTFR